MDEAGRRLPEVQRRLDSLDEANDRQFGQRGIFLFEGVNQAEIRLPALLEIGHGLHHETDQFRADPLDRFEQGLAYAVAGGLDAGTVNFLRDFGLTLPVGP